MSPTEQRQALSKLGVPDHAINRAVGTVLGGNTVLVPVWSTVEVAAGYVHVDPRQLRYPIRLVLPWSHLVSDNRKYGASIQRAVNGKVFPRLLITKEYREAKRKTRDVAREAMTVDGLTFRPLAQPLSLTALVWVPDNRPGHDVANFCKNAHDALEKLIYAKDEWLHHIQWTRAGVDVDRPRAEIEIKPL